MVLACTHERTLDVVPLEALREHAVDVPDDLGICRRVYRYCYQAALGVRDGRGRADAPNV